MLVATVDAAQLSMLRTGGFDIVGVTPLAELPQNELLRRDVPAAPFEVPRLVDAVVAVRLVLSPAERAYLEEQGLHLALWRDDDGLTARDLIRLQQEEGYEVWRSWDEEGGIRDELYALADQYPDITQLNVLGTSVQDREIIAIKVTKDARSTRDGSRPAVLYNALQHAREWIAVEVDRRLLHYFVENYGVDDEVTQLVDTRELWFIVVANPDGYQYSHDVERMWRKNLRDNDGDGEITNADGVDPNRNFDAHWGWDNEGSSPRLSSSSYRGTAPASEPMTVAQQGLMDRVPFAFVVNYHSVGPALLTSTYTWQTDTPTADQPIFSALTGTSESPAVEGFDVSEMLYLTNGNTREYAHGVAGALCWTPELSDGGSGGGFIFPDDEELVQREFELNLPFALDLARSAADPASPVSHLGNTVEPMQISPFEVSYGDPQAVQVNAARYLGDVELKFRIGDGAVRSAPTTEWDGGLRYGDIGDVHFAQLRGQVEGAEVGDDVTVWFEAGDVTSDEFTYHLVSDSDAPVLVLAAEDYTGISPVYGDVTAPLYAEAYLDSIAANGVPADLYDIDAAGRVAPDALGVLSHYSLVVWYTGDDIVTRDKGMGPGTVSRLAADTMLAVRDYLNEGGKLLYAGKYAGYQYSAQAFSYDPRENTPCRLAGSGVDCRTLNNDFAQYYLGVNSYERNIDSPIDQDNLAGQGTGWWSGSAGNLDNTAGRNFDLTGVAGSPTFSFDAYWNAEVDFDYGSFEASLDGGQTWEALPDLDGVLTNEDPNDANPGWGLTGHGAARLRFDLSPFAGEERLGLRFRYISDRRTNFAGFYVDNLLLSDESGTLYHNDLENDFSDWTLAGWSAVPPAPPDGPAVYPVRGLVAPFDDLSWDFDTEHLVDIDHSGAGVPTSLSLPTEDFPQFESWNAAWYENPARMPHTGDYHVYSGKTRYSYQRLSRNIDLTDSSNNSISFWLSYDVRQPWDAVFLEVRTAGEDDWTTLPEASGATSPSAALNCTTGSWYNRFPQLSHYMSVDDSDTEPVCAPQGSTGEWNAATGSSDGWRQWSFDLSAYDGRQIEVAIAYVSSRLAFPGVYVDDVELSTGDETSFEDGWDGWEVPGAPPGSTVKNTVDFSRATLADEPAGAAVVTPNSIFFGFGLEGIATARDRSAVMGRVLDYFGIEPPPPPTWKLFAPLLRNRL